jgi:hypothetical protein
MKAAAETLPGLPDSTEFAMKRLRTLLKTLIIACIILMPALSQAGDEQYGYPLHDAYAATIMGTPAELRAELPQNVPTRELTLEVIPGRKSPEIFHYNTGLNCVLAYQKQRAPLIFLIAGTGAGSQAAHQLFLMQALYGAGFHVITLPSPTIPNFIISASRGSVPGAPVEDAIDLYQTMETAWKAVSKDIEVSDFYLAGYSLGGTQSAFVAKLDEERKVFNFRKVLMINPVISTYTAAGRIEDLLKAVPGGNAKVGAFFNRMLDKFSQFYVYRGSGALDDTFMYDIYKKNVFSREEAGGMIGFVFRVYSAGMIFTSDVMTNGGYVVPKNRVLKVTDSLYEYFQVSTHLNLFNYLDEYLFPWAQRNHPGISKQEFIDSLSLRSIGDYLKSSDKFGVMTNADDFLLTADDLEFFRQTFSPRATIFPFGGHLGNIQYKENVARMIQFFKQ